MMCRRLSRASPMATIWLSVMAIIFSSTANTVLSQEVEIPTCGADCIQNMESLYFIGICITGACDCSRLASSPGGPYVATCVQQKCASQNVTVFEEWYKDLCGAPWQSSFMSSIAAQSTSASSQATTTPAITTTQTFSSSSTSQISTTISSASLASSTTLSKPTSSSSGPFTSQATTTSPTSSTSASSSSSVTVLSASTSSGGQSGLSTGASIGIGISIAIIAILGLAGLLFWLRHRRKAKSLSLNQIDPSLPAIAEAHGNSTTKNELEGYDNQKSELDAHGNLKFELDAHREIGAELEAREVPPIVK